ncbi:13977_t:CDS:2 [Funneliformis caledonium]|uniref:13977_t:CDS:1 n=1 Tax=Funneliformis caledonium TaxID=1117310 RepID=A0A9N9BMB0_9GLOM|nr:13977_t:CDS:2 [Funneliformis caledonium]
MTHNITSKGNQLPSLEQLSALAKGRVPQNPIVKNVTIQKSSISK